MSWVLVLDILSLFNAIIIKHNLGLFIEIAIPLSSSYNKAIFIIVIAYTHLSHRKEV